MLGFQKLDGKHSSQTANGAMLLSSHSTICTSYRFSTRVLALSMPAGPFGVTFEIGQEYLVVENPAKGPWLSQIAPSFVRSQDTSEGTNKAQ